MKHKALNRNLNLNILERGKTWKSKKEHWFL